MNIIIGFIIGYIVARIVAGKKEGDKLDKSVRFSVGDHYLHLHHWILGVLFILVFGSLIVKLNSNILFGFAIGVIIQGIHYHDHLIVWYKKKDEKKIYDTKDSQQDTPESL